MIEESPRRRETLYLTEVESVQELTRQLEHAAALNSRTEQLVHRMRCLLAREVVLACLLIIRLVLV